MIADWYGLSAFAVERGQVPAGAAADALSPSGVTGLAPGGLWSFWCHNCLTDWPEPFCDWCGAALKIERAEGQNLEVAALRSEGESR